MTKKQTIKSFRDGQPLYEKSCYTFPDKNTEESRFLLCQALEAEIQEKVFENSRCFSNFHIHSHNEEISELQNFIFFMIEQEKKAEEALKTILNIDKNIQNISQKLDIKIGAFNNLNSLECEMNELISAMQDASYYAIGSIIAILKKDETFIEYKYGNTTTAIIECREEC